MLQYQESHPPFSLVPLTLRNRAVILQNLMGTPDFDEGVRARLVDKDNNPAWHPSSLEGVSDSHLEALFAGIGDLELDVSLARD